MLDRVRGTKRRASKAAEAVPAAAELAEYQMLRQWYEPLEKREYLSANLGSWQFSSSTSSQETAVQTVFTNNTGSASITGSMAISGGDSFSGTFTITAGGGGNFSVAASGVSVNLNGLASVTGGSGTFALSSSTFSGSLSAGSLSLGGGVSMSGPSLSMAWSTSGDTHLRVGASGTLNVSSGQGLAGGTFSFEKSGSDVSVSVSGASVSMASGLVSVAGLSGTLDLSSSGVKVSGTAANVAASFDAGGAHFSGSLHLDLDTTATDKNIRLTGTGMNITVGGMTFGGDLTFEQIVAQPASGQTTGTPVISVGVLVSNVDATIADGGTTIAHFTSPSGSGNASGFMFQDGAFSGVVKGTVAVSKPGGGTTSVTGVIEVNSGNKELTFVDPTVALTTPPTYLTVPAGPIVSGFVQGVDINVSSTQTIHGDFGFSVGSASGHTVATVTAANVSGTFGAASLSGASGLLQVGVSGGAIDVSGSVSGAISFAGGGVSATGAFTASFDNTGTHIGATGVSIIVHGESFTGNFSVDAQATQTSFTISDAALHFGSDLLTVEDLAGSFTIDSSGSASGTVSGTLAASIGQAAFAGGVGVTFGAGSLTLSGTGDSLTIGDEEVTGDFTLTDSGSGNVALTANNVNAYLGNGLVKVSGASLSVTASSGSVIGSFSGQVDAGAGVSGVSFSGNVTVTVAPGEISAAGTGDHFTVNGQTFDADFTFSKDAQGLALGVSGVNMDLGSGAITVSGASGTLLIPADKSGVTGTLSAAFASNLAAFTGQLDISFSPGAFALAASGVNLTIGGQTISGDMGITVDGADLDLTADNLTASLGGGLVLIGPPAAGQVVPPTTLKIHAGVFLGSFGGVVTVGSATGVGFSGLVTVTVGGGEITASGTDCVLSVGGQDITANFSFSKVGSDLKVHVDGVNFSVGTLLSVQGASGDLTVTGTGVTGSATGTVSSGIGNLQGTLSVGFAPGVLKLSGQNNKLVFGDQSIGGDFDFVKDSSGLHLAVTNFTADLGGGLVSVTGGSATLNVDQASGAVTGSLSGTVAAGATLVSAGVNFGGSISVSVGNGVIAASGTNDTLTIGSASFSTSFDFFKDASGLELKVKGLNFSLGNVISVAGAQGTLRVDSTGISGSTSGTVSSTLAGLSGTFGVGFEPGKLVVSGKNDSLSIGGQTLAGDFEFTLVSGNDLDLDISNLTANLGGGLVKVGGQNGVGASAHLSVSGSAITGDFNGYLGVGTGTGFAFGGQVAVHVDSAGGIITASATGATLTVAGQTLSGDFAFAKNGSDLQVTIAHVAFSLGSVIGVQDVSGSVVVGQTGLSGTVAGTITQSMAGLTADSFGIAFSPGVLAISATNAALNIGGQSISGDFSFRQDNTGLKLTSNNITAKLGGGLVKVAGGSANLSISNGNVSGGFTGNVSVDSGMTGGVVGFSGLVNVQVAPGSITASGTGDTLTVGGYQLTTDFGFSKVGADLHLTVANLNFSLGGALTISNAGGDLTVTSAGVSGSASGSVSSSIAGVTLGGTLGVAFAPGTISISGTNDYLEASGQRVSGDFSFTKDVTGLHLTASNFSASLGGGLVTVDNGAGALDVANGAVTGSFSGTLHAGTVGGGVAFDGPINVAVTAGGISASTGAGQVDTLTIGGATVSAGFSFTKDANGLELTVSDLTAALGPVSLTDGGGTLLISNAGVSGTATGTLATAFTGFGFSGTLAATFGPGLFKLSGTNNKLTVGDQSISGDFSFLKDNTGVHLSASNLSASFGGGVVSITNGSGTLDVASGGGISGSFAATVAAGAGTSGFSMGGSVSVSVSPGSITASGTNDSLTVLGNSMQANFYFHKDASGLELDVSGVNLSFASGTVAVNNAGGTLLVTKTGVSGSIHGGLSASIPNVTFNSTNFDMSFAPGTLAISGTGVSLTAYGQTISGNFGFTSNPSSVALHVDNLSLSLGGVVNVTQGTGDFTLTKGAGGGMVGSASGNVQIAGVGPDVQFGGTFSVAVGNNTVSVSGTGTSLTLFGQKLSGNFSFTKTATAVDFHVSSLNLNLGGGLLLVTGGAADFNIDSGGLVGSASGTISVGGGLSGFSIGGTVSVVISHTGLSVEGSNTQITIAGQTVSAEHLSFSRNNSTGALSVAVTNLGLAIDGNPLPVELNGSMIVAATGFAGTLTGHANLGGVDGTVSVNFGNGQFTVSAGVNASFSDTIGPVAISGTVSATGSTNGSASISLTDLSINLGNGVLTVTGGSADFDYSGGTISGTATGTLALNGVPGVSLGGTVTVTITKVGANRTISVSGTGMSLTVLGQTISGNFSFVDNGNGTIQLGATNVSVSLADAISLTGGTASFTLGKTGANAGLKGTGSGNLSVALPGVGFSTQFGLDIDNTGGQSKFKVAANPMTITVGGIGLTGSFAVQKVTTATGKTTVSIVASNIDTFLGDGTTGVHITNAGGAILVLPTGTAIDVYGAAALEGVDALQLAGTLHVRMNNTGGAMSQVVPVPDLNNPGQTVNQTLTFAGNQQVMVAGTATLNIGDGSGNTFVALTGGFSVSKNSSTSGTITTTKLDIGAAGISAYIGAGDPNGSDAMGVKISDAQLGLVVVSTANSVGNTHTAGYAISASGAAALLGVPVLSLSGSLAVRSNTAGPNVDETIQVPDPANPGSTIPVQVKFAVNQLPAFAGSVALGIADPNDPNKQFVSLSGDFAFSRSVSGNTTKVLASVNNAQAFIGVGGANPIGLQLTGGMLGLVMIKTGSAASTYALAASGNVGTVGLPGLFVGGDVGISVNNTGSAQPNPAGGADIPAGALTASVDGMTMAIRDSDNNDIVSISIDATITKTGSLVDINATSATFAINAGSQPLVSVTGAVELTVGANGLNLGPAGFHILGFSILGDAVQPVPSAPVQVPVGGAPVASGPVVGNAGAGDSTGSMGTGASIPAGVGVPRKIGPLSLYNLKPAFNGFSFSGGQLSANVGLKADTVDLALGSAQAGGTTPNGPNAGGVTARMTGFQGTLGLAVGLDLSSFKVTNFGPTGAFDFHATQFVLDVPKVLNVNASNIDIHYDPKATSPQKILSIGSATLTVPIGASGNGIQGQIAPATDENGKQLPGLEVWSDHLQLGRGTLKYIGTVGISSFVQITNPFVSVTDLNASFAGSLDFHGSITIGADAVKLGPSALQFTGTSVAATLTKTGSDWGFSFSAGTLGLSVASVVSLSATNVAFNPAATGSETLISVGSLNAQLKLSSLTLSGTAGGGPGDTMKVLGDGTLQLPDNFSIGVNFSAGTSGDLGWPSWLPIQPESVLLTWPHFNADKTNFTIDLSAGVGGTYGPITLSGHVSHVIIDVQKLINGQFPIVDIGSVSVTASGPAFGGSISGTLIMGVVKLDALNHQVAPGDAYDHTVFYAGIEGELTTPEFGLAMRFGISQNGPLEAYVQADADIPIVPPIGLAIKSLYGGITFDAQPFPNITNASDLKSPVFSTGVELTATQWEKQLKQEVVNQSGGGAGGYLFSLTTNVNGIVAGLASNDVSPLVSDFLSYGYTLTSATVVTESAGQEWLIKDASKYYLLAKDLAGNIEVSRYRFVLDSAGTGARSTVASVATVAAALNAGSVTQDVRDTFAAYGISLSNAASVQGVAPKTPGQPVSEWVVTDGSFKYHVTKDAAAVLTVDASGGSMAGMGGVIRIEAGITLGIEGMPADEFSATGEVVIETDGKLMFNANAVFAHGTAEFNFRSFIDLSTISGGHLVALFYFEQDVTVPALGTFPRLVVAGGVEFGLTDASNQFIDPTDPVARANAQGFGVKLTGEIDYYALPSVGLKLTGEAQLVFTSTEAVLTFDASLSATITSFIQANNVVSAAGAFTIRYGGGPFAVWGAAEVKFDSGAIPFLDSVGIRADAQIFLRINTDTIVETAAFDIPKAGGGTDHESFQLQPGSFGLYLVGELTFKKGPINFVMGGIFSVDFVYNSATHDFRFDMFVFAHLNLGVADVTLLTTDALGLLEIDNDGFAAMLAVKASAGTDSATTKQLFTFDFNFTLFTNTTGHEVDYTLPADLTAIIKQDDNATMAGNDSLISSLETVLGQLSTTYGAGNGGLVSTDGQGNITMKVPAGMPRIGLLGDYEGQAADGAYFVVQGAGNVTVLQTFELSGSFVIQASADGVALGAQAKLHLGPIADIAASGFMDVSAAGVYAALTLSSSINLGGFASFGGAAVLEVNTTGADQKVKEYTYNESTNTVSNTPVDVTIPAAQVFRLDIKGQLQLAGYFNLSGEFEVIFSAGSVTTITIGVNAHLAFFGLDVSIGGSAVIAIDGSNVAFAVDAKAHLGVNLAGIVDIAADAHFEISTFAGNQPVPDPDNLGSTVSITPGVHVDLGGHIKILSIFEFDITGSVDYNAITHVFTLAVTGTADIDLFVFHANINIGGWIDSTGQFAVGVEGGIGFDAGIAGLNGSAWMYVAYMAGSPTIDGGSHLPTSPPADRSGTRVLTIGGGGHLDIDVFGITLVGVDVDFSVNSNLDLYFHAVAHLNFLLFSVDIGFTVNVGSFGGHKPDDVYLAGIATQGQVAPGSFFGGQLVLNVGSRAGNRNFQNSDHNETVTVQGSGNLSPSKTQTIYVTIDGYTQTFKNVSSLLIPGDGAETINILSSVQVPLKATVGSGGKIYNASTAAATLQGSAGDDVIQTGSGATTVIGGGGNDTILIGSGSANVTTSGAGNSRVLWNTDSSGDVTWAGSGGGETLYATANTPDNATYAHGETLTMAKVGGGYVRLAHPGQHAISFAGVPNMLLSAPGGGNTLSVGDVSGTSLASLVISYGQTHGLGNALSLAGSSGADTYTLSSGTGALPVMPSITNLNPAASNITVATNTIARTGGLSVTVYGTDATTGDSIVVNSKGGNDNFYLKSVSVPTTLMGNDTDAPAPTPYSTYYYVGWQGSGKKGTLSSVTALLNLKGGQGKDVLVMDDTADFYNRSFTLTDTQLVSDALGTGGRLVYDAKMDNFNLSAGTGHNTYVIQGTGAVGATAIHGGDTDLVINAPLAAPLAVDGGDTLGGPNTLTVNGTFAADAFVIGAGYVLGAGAPLYFTNFQALAINGNGGDDTYLVSGNTVPVTITGSAGNEAVTIDGAAADVTVDTGAGSDTVTINGSAATVAVTARANATFNVYGNAASATLAGGTGVSTFNVFANNGTLALVGGTGINALNAFNVYGNTKDLSADANGGASTFVVTNIASAVNLTTGNAVASLTVSAPLYAPVNVTGGTTVQNLTVNGTAGPDAFTISNGGVTGAGAAISYTGLMAVTVNGLGGDDTFVVASNNAPTTITAGLGNSTYTVQTLSAALTVTTGTGISASTVNLATRLADLQGAVTVNGTGNDTLNVSDAGSNAGGTGTLTDTTLSGFGMAAGGITFAEIKTLDVAFGGGADVLAVNAVSNTTTAVSVETAGGDDAVNLQAVSYPLHLATGAGTNVVNAGLALPLPATGAVLVKLQGAITVDGTGGSTTLGLDNTGDTSPETLAVSATTLTGLSMGAAGITYTSLAAVNASLGTGGNVVEVATTAAGTVTSFTGGTGNDTFNVHATVGALAINTGVGTNVVNVSGTTLAAMQGAITVTGGGTATLNVSDVGDTADQLGTVADSLITGFGLGGGGIAYNTIDTLNLTLGSGNLVVLVASTANGTATTVATGAGDDQVGVSSTGTSPTSILTGDGDDLVAVFGTTGVTNVAVGTGDNQVYVQSFAATLDDVQGAVNITGNGTDTININDSGSTADKTVSVSDAAVAVSGSATINYVGDTGLATLNLSLGSGVSSLTILTTRAGATTNVTTGSNADVVTIEATGGVTNVDAGGGDDVVTVHGTGATTTVTLGDGSDTITVGSTAHTLDGVQGGLVVVGKSDGDTLSVDDSGATVARVGALSPASLTGFGMGTSGIAYSGITTFNLALGTVSTDLAVNDTPVGQTTNVSGTSGSDTITFNATTGAVNVNGSSGTNVFKVRQAGGPVTITSAVGAHDTVSVTADGTVGAVANLTVVGNGTDVLTADDSAGTAGRTVTLSGSHLTFAGPGANVTYSGLASVSLALGSGDDGLTVPGTSAPTTITAGDGADVITVQDVNNPTSINTGVGANSVSVLAAHASLAITSPVGAVSTVLLGNAAHQVADLASPVTVAGSGADTLVVDDGGDAGSPAVTLTATTVSGLAPADVTYSGVRTLVLQLGSGAENVTVASTAAGTTTNVSMNAGGGSVTVQSAAGPVNVDTGASGAAVSIEAAAGAVSVTTPGTGASVVAVGKNGLVDGVAGSLTVSGPGSLTLDDSANTTPKFVTLTSGKVIGLTGAAVNYSGLTTLTLSLGNADEVLNVISTAAGTATSVNTNGPSAAVSVTSTGGPLVLNTTAGHNNQINLSSLGGFRGAVTVNGSGSDLLTVDETGDAGNAVGTVSATQITGLSPAAITYGGVSTLTLTLGSGSNVLAVRSSSASTVLASGAGTDQITVGSTAPATGGQMSGIASPLSVLGNDNGTLILDDSGSAVGKTVKVTTKRVTGMSPAPVNFANLSALAILLGSGADVVTVSDTAARSTSVDTGAGNDAVAVDATTNPLSVATGTGTNTVSIASPDDIDGAVSVNGSGGATTLNLDGSGSTANRNVTLSNSGVTGVAPARVSYGGLATLNVTLGGGSDVVTVTSTAGRTTTNLDTGGGFDVVTVSVTGPNSVAGPLNLDGSGGGNTLIVNGSADSTDRAITVGPATVGGFGAAIGYANFRSLWTALGTGTNGFAIDGSGPTVPVVVTTGGPLTATLHYTGDLTSQVILPGNSTTTVAVDGSLRGVLSTGGTITSMTVGQDLSGAVSAAAIRTATILGNDRGTVQATTIGNVYLPSGTPAADGTVFSATQGPSLRTIKALSVDGAPVGGVHFTVAYDGSAGASPQAAVRVDNPTPYASRFDLLLDTRYPGEAFDLSRLESKDGNLAGVRNVVVSGSMLTGMTPGEQALLGPAGGPIGGGVYLPQDKLAAVSVRNDLPAQTVYARSIEALSFATNTAVNGKVRTTDQVAVSKQWSNLLNSILVMDPATRRPVAKVVKPSDPIMLVASDHPQGVFVGRMTRAKGKPTPLFDTHVTYITDQANSDVPVLTTLQYAASPKNGRPVISDVAFNGNGGSIDTTCYVGHIGSTGAVGDVTVRADAAEVLQKIDAPSVGRVNLFGGRLIGAAPVKGKGHASRHK